MDAFSLKKTRDRSALAEADMKGKNICKGDTELPAPDQSPAQLTSKLRSDEYESISEQ
jgi:hypothetical protein